MPEANGVKGNNQQLAYDAEKDKTQEEQSSDDDRLRDIQKKATLEQERKRLGLDGVLRFDEEPDPKEKTKLKAAELKEMQDLSEPEYQALDNLSPDELMDTVVSTYYARSFMHPEIETIISHHWDDIFSQTIYNWRVVLRYPESVIIPFQEKGIWKAFLCQPFPKCKGMYEAALLNNRGRIIRKITQKMPVTLLEAVEKCEEEILSIWGSMVGGDVVDNLSRSNRIDDTGYDPALNDTFEKYLRERGISLDGVLAELKTLGLSEENIERLKDTSLMHAYYVLDKLKNDVVPTREELIKAAKLYADVMRLSKRDMRYVNRNTPKVVAVSANISKAGPLTITVNDFDKLTPTDQKALEAEIIDMVNERIQEYLQKTKSKKTSKKSSS